MCSSDLMDLIVLICGNISSPVIPFPLINTTNIKNQLAVISNLRIQYEPLIQTGSVDVETKSAEFKKKLEEVGLSTVLAEIQSQIDAFLAKK